MNALKKLKNNPWLVAGGIVLVVVAWMVSGAAETAAPQAASAEAQAQATDVRVRHQQAEAVERFINVYGRTEPARSVTLKAETVARVEEIVAPRGTRVERGEVIVRLDVRDRRAQLERARAEVTAAKLRYEAEQKLQHESFASETRLAEARAQYEAAEAELKRIEIDLANTAIRAPFDGVVQQQLVEKGDYVALGDPVATFVDTNTLVVTGSVAETERAHLETGSTATARLVTGQEATGKVTYIAPVADESTRTFGIRVEVANPDGLLPAGVTAELKLPAGITLAHKVSPSILTLDENGEIGIKTVNEDKTVKFTKVNIIKSTGEGVWIDGLPAIANIIVVGQGFVKPGETVVPVREGAPVGVAAVANASAQDAAGAVE